MSLTAIYLRLADWAMYQMFIQLYICSVASELVLFNLWATGAAMYCKNTSTWPTVARGGARNLIN